MGVGVLGPYIQVVVALKSGLETELDTENLAKTECKIQVACEWITYGAKVLLSWAQENIGYVDVAEDDTQYFPGGSLYHGPPAMCLQRWGFWQTRFEGLGKDPSLRGEIRKAASKAAETIWVLSKGAWPVRCDVSMNRGFKVYTPSSVVIEQQLIGSQRD
jgi:hypothetical protein